MNEIIKNQKRSNIILPMMLAISMIMIEQLNLGSTYTGTEIEPTLYNTGTDKKTTFYTLKLQEAPANYNKFPGEGQKVGGHRTDSNLVPENNYLYNKNTKNLSENANRLIEENIRGPKEQAAVLFFYQAPFVIDIMTRMPVLYTLEGQPIMQNNIQQSIPSVKQILEKIQHSSFSYESKAEALQVLKIYLDAIDDAKQVAAIEAYFDANQQNYYFYQTANAQLTEILDQQAKKIRTMIDEVKAKTISENHREFTYNNINLSNKNHILFSINNVNEIIKHNDFREKIKNRNNKEELVKAAELLIQQCFIAQQQHLKDTLRLKKFYPKDILKNYIFQTFPNFDNLISIASEIANQDKKAANKLFKAINQAVQTALYIAKKESNYYITTDPFVKILYDMHKKIDQYCINPDYGATIEDINRNAMWTALATAGYGLAIASAASAAYYYKDIPEQISSTIYNNSKAIQALDKKTNQALTEAQNKLLETGKYVVDVTGNIVPNISQTIKNADKAIADYLNPSYLTQAQQTWKNFNWDTTTQGWKNFNFQSSNFTVDPIIEQYQ